MEKERLQEYAARVTQANRSELVVIIYEATIASIEEGKKYLSAGEIEPARKEIARARGMITELMGSLDLQYEIFHFFVVLHCDFIKELFDNWELSIIKFEIRGYQFYLAIRTMIK